MIKRKMPAVRRGHVFALARASARAPRVGALVVEGRRLVAWGVAAFLGWALAVAAGVGAWLGLDHALGWLR